MGMNDTHWRMEKRTMIQSGLEQGTLRPPSTIRRELKRNGWGNPAAQPRRRVRPRVAGGYRATVAQALRS